MVSTLWKRLIVISRVFCTFTSVEIKGINYNKTSYVKVDLMFTEIHPLEVFKESTIYKLYMLSVHMCCACKRWIYEKVNNKFLNCQESIKHFCTRIQSRRPLVIYIQFIFEFTHFKFYPNSKWAPSWQNLPFPYANYKGADQPAHPRSLISTFVVRCLDSVIPLLAISEISSI